MKEFPWKGVALGSGILTVLVAARCAVTVGFLRYYYGTTKNWMDKLMEDPWFFIGMTAAVLCVVALLVLADQEDKKNKTEDGCEA